MKSETETVKSELLRQIEDTRKLKLTNKELIERLKSEASKATSIRNSTVSNSSLMESFSPEMLSPE